jgi:hypothetical protein
MSGVQPESGPINTPGQLTAAQPAKRGRRRWLRCVLFVSIAVVCLYLFRAPLLRSAENFLVVEQQLAAADYVLILDGDRRYDQAAELLRAGHARQILVIEAKPERLQRKHLAPSPEDEARRELRARAVPGSSVHLIPGQAFTDWDRARSLSDWLNQRPQTKLVILCDQLGSRRLRHILDQVLGAEKARQVYLRPLAQRWHEGIDWWQKREGVLGVGQGYLRLSYVWLFGEGAQAQWREWDPEEYERALQ